MTKNLTIQLKKKCLPFYMVVELKPEFTLRDGFDIPKIIHIYSITKLNSTYTKLICPF